MGRRALVGCKAAGRRAAAVAAASHAASQRAHRARFGCQPLRLRSLLQLVRLRPGERGHGQEGAESQARAQRCPSGLHGRWAAKCRMRVTTQRAQNSAVIRPAAAAPRHLAPAREGVATRRPMRLLRCQQQDARRTKPCMRVVLRASSQLEQGWHPAPDRPRNPAATADRRPPPLLACRARAWPALLRRFHGRRLLHVCGSRSCMDSQVPPLPRWLGCGGGRPARCDRSARALACQQLAGVRHAAPRYSALFHHLWSISDPPNQPALCRQEKSPLSPPAHDCPPQGEAPAAPCSSSGFMQGPLDAVHRGAHWP